MTRAMKLCFEAAALALAMAAALIGFAGCASSLNTLPTPQQLDALGAVPDGVDARALRRGRALVVTACAECHKLYWPHAYRPEAWRPLARKMGRLASLSRRQIADLELYLVTASRSAQRQASQQDERHTGPRR